ICSFSSTKICEEKCSFFSNCCSIADSHLHIGIFHFSHLQPPLKTCSQKARGLPLTPGKISKLYQHILALVFAVEEINENPNILPNVTLGFHIYDSYCDSKMTYCNTQALIFNSHNFISYGSFQPELNDQLRFPSFYRMVPNEALQYQGIVELLVYFRWKWVGLMAIDDEGGEHFLQTIEPMLLQNKICSAFIRRIGTNLYTYFIELMHPEYQEKVSAAKVWITTAQIEFTFSKLHDLFYAEMRELHGALSFAIHSNDLPGFQEFIQNVRPSWANEDGFIRTFWEQAFKCRFPNAMEQIDDTYKCTGEEMLESLPAPYFAMSITGHSYSIYTAAYALAHALHIGYSSRANNRTIETSGRPSPQTVEPWKLHSFLQRMSFNNSAGDEITFNKHGELVGGFDIRNLVTFPNRSYIRVKVGKMDPQAPPGKEFSIYEDRIKWHWNLTQVPPLSVCNDNCHPGYHKKKKEGEKSCCYDCAPCPDGMFSNEIVLVFGIFIKYQDTAIVKANNRSLTYILLISLLFCFLCSLMFLGRPNVVNCLLRQTAFGIIFSVALSSILAKTISVVLAFMATKPGSRMRTWLGQRLTFSIVLSCSKIQIGICTLWLATSAPFPDVDTYSMAEEIILLCNEGSSIMFYCVLGYLGFLAFLSFTVAFLARKLPDSFNEAKFITFSMLVFCSVWLSFVPTYLSTSGKYMVAVEIFSILASSAGLLCCIFFPKCYIILLKPELNNKDQLIRRKL
uniref:G-protein coupled receptors family 3 profile domain-containing protein n=1 Tax=Podarcis muralis TaxID=64176 RepID=A0A670J9S6_PODMU